MTPTQRRYNVSYSPDLRAFVIYDADLRQAYAVDGEPLKFRTMRAAGECLRGAGLDTVARSTRATKVGDRDALRVRASGFVAMLAPMPLTWEDFESAGQGPA
jgi:hypothetical protein